MTEAKRMPETLRRTALFEAHRALGASSCPSAGSRCPCSMPASCASTTRCDGAPGCSISRTWAQFALRGANVGAWAETLTVNLVATMKPGQARYNIFTNAHGGAHDDVIFYRLTPTAGCSSSTHRNADKMWAHLASAAAPAGIEVVNNHGVDALIAIQGPRAGRDARADCRRRFRGA